MTTEHSTYTYGGGEQETVTLTRGPGTPHGHALLRINYSDARTADCYVNTAWLRDRLNDFGEPLPLTPDAITDEMVGRGYDALMSSTKIGVPFVRELLTAALTEPPKRPEGAEAIERLLMDADRDGGEAYRANGYAGIADYLAARLNVSPKEGR